MISGVHILNISPADRARKETFPAQFDGKPACHYVAACQDLDLPSNHHGPPDVQALLAVQEKYGLEMDMASIPTLVERHGLVTDEPPT